MLPTTTPERRKLSLNYLDKFKAQDNEGMHEAHSRNDFVKVILWGQHLDEMLNKMISSEERGPSSEERGPMTNALL